MQLRIVAQNSSCWNNTYQAGGFDRPPAYNCSLIMDTKIIAEHKASFKYDLERIANANEPLVKLTRDNVARVESMIRHDSDYSNSANTDSDRSSAFWLNKLAGILLKEAKVSKEEYHTILLQCVTLIDRENSTHLNADGVGRIELTRRIEELDKRTLLRYLREPQRDKYKLVEILTEKTHPKEERMKPRQNLSFASKFCHYACMYIFKGVEEQDNFSIYDSVVCTNIPKYAMYYHISLPKNYKLLYKDYIATIDKIIDASGNQISRNGFDHLIWYFHKAK